MGKAEGASVRGGETRAETEVRFQVHLRSEDTPAAESRNSVWLIGSTQPLGQWIPANAIPMTRVERIDSGGTGDTDGMTWAVERLLPSNSRVEYRYFIGQASQLFADKVIVAKWEAFVSPRSLLTKTGLKPKVVFGKLFPKAFERAQPEEENPVNKNSCPEILVTQDTFGQLGESCDVDIGWLTNQMEVRLSFLKNPIRWWKKRHQQQHYAMKISAADPKDVHHGPEASVDPSASMASLQDHALAREEDEGILGPVKYAVLTAPKNNKGLIVLNKAHRGNSKGYNKQHQFGVPLSIDENLIFKVQTEDPRNLYFTIDFYVLDHPKSLENAPYFAGSCHILYTNFTSEESQITAPIYGRHSNPIGQVTFNYLVIRPLQTKVLDMSKSRHYHWQTGDTKEVGHRGMGASYKHTVDNSKPDEHVRENSIRSLVTAGRCGADFVECDVQLTKDRIPILYHDFNVKVNLRKRVLDNMDDMKDSNFELCDMAVKDLTLQQLQSLQTYHASVEEHGPRDWRTDPTAADSDEADDLMPFPTLEKVLHTLDEGVGVNVEIKYPQFIDHGEDGLEHEQMHFFDRNDYLDTILKTLLRHGGSRHVIISCFDSDACVMLKKKQNRFPVLFLTQGQTHKYPPYKDFRTLSIPAAIKFACAEQLVGLSVHSEDLLREASLVAETKRAGLLLFCWGEDNNDHDNIRYLKSLGVDGIICDRTSSWGEDARKSEIVSSRV